MSPIFWRYGLWALTLGTIWWVCAIISAIVAGKGADPSTKEIPTEETA